MKLVVWQTKPGLLGALLGLLGGCYTEPLVMTRTGPLPQPATLPMGRPAPVEIPGPPPPPREEGVPGCDEGEAGLPGYWEYYGEWSWVAPFCARVPGGYAYVPPRYDEGSYLRPHLIEDEGAGRLRPARVRLVHPQGAQWASDGPRPGASPLRPGAAALVVQQPLDRGFSGPDSGGFGPSRGATQDVEGCLLRATTRRGQRDIDCAQLLGGHIRVR